MAPTCCVKRGRTSANQTRPTGQGDEGCSQTVSRWHAPGDEPRKLIAFVDPDAARPFQGRSWMADALKAMGVELLVVDIPEHVKASVRAAQARQFR
jgi:hypothetical protein